MLTDYREGRIPAPFGQPPVKVAKDDCPHEWKCDEPSCLHCGAALQLAK